MAKRVVASAIILSLLVLPVAPVSTSAQEVFDVSVAGPFHASPSSFPSMTIGQGGRPYLIWQDQSLGRVQVASYGRESGAIENILSVDDLGGLATSPYPKIVAAGSNIFTAWIDCCGAIGGSGALAISYSTDFGATYSRNLFAPVQSAWEVDIATDGASLYVVWTNSSDREPGTIMFSKLILGTTSFTETKPLADKSLNPAVTVERPNVYAAWVNETGSLFLLRSTDNGQTFAPVSEIDSGRSATRSTPRLASQGGNVYLVWQSEEADGVHLRFAASTNNGTSFSDPGDIDEVPGFRADLNPSLSIGQDDNLYLAWVSYKFYIDSGLTIRAKKAPLSGGSWEEFDVAARKTGKTDHVQASIVADSSSSFFVLYELLEERQGWSQFREVRLVTSLPITSPAYWLGQLFGHPIVVVALAAAALAASAGTVLFLYQRQYGLKPGPSRVFGFLARFLRGRRRPRKE